MMARDAKDWSDARERMVLEIERLTRAVARDLGVRELDHRVLAAMRSVPRHEFVPEEDRAVGYANRPLPIGHGQTISQPFIVALMTHLLKLTPRAKVLEVGAGSGYQTAVLAALAHHVYSVEILEDLACKASRNLSDLGADNVSVKFGDGYSGWPEHAPFDAIIVTAAPDHIPAQLVAQLKGGGRMVIPVGQESQELMVIEKGSDGGTTSREIIPVRFVPLTRSGGQS